MRRDDVQRYTDISARPTKTPTAAVCSVGGDEGRVSTTITLPTCFTGWT